MRRYLEAEIEVGPVIDPTMHHRGPCVIELAERDFGFRLQSMIEEGIKDWIQGVWQYEAR